MTDLTRRGLLAAGGAGLVLAGLAPRLSLADAPGTARFVFVILRGGMDGLAAVPAYGDPVYKRLRGDLTDEGRYEGLDGFFALGPGLERLAPLYRRGELTVMHAVATPYRERSHFDGQDVLESGEPAAGQLEDGWLNRALGVMGGSPLQAVALGSSVPLVLRGENTVASWGPSVLPRAGEGFVERLERIYAADAELGPVFQAAMEARAMADEATRGLDADRNRSADEQSVTLAQAAGRFLSEPDGARIATLELDDWDTHTRQARRLPARLETLGQVIETLKTALGETWRETVVAVATEFGRTVEPNGTGGTDHGTATVAFLAGGAVEGGRVIADWPGLDAGRLYEGRDLAPTLDLRAVLKGVLADHMGFEGGALDRVVFRESGDIAPMRELVRG